MKTDAQLKQDVLNELKWDSSINETEVGVAVKDGIVTLSGYLDNYVQKLAAENAAKGVSGTKGVVQQIEVKLSSNNKKTDAEIAKSSLESLQWNTSVPSDGVLVKVDDGWVTLAGSINGIFKRKLPSELFNI